jgi:hypothetical protein
MKYQELPRFTKVPSYRVHMAWSYLPKWIEEMQKDYGIDLSPDYQRDHVWTDEQASRYIEYSMKGGVSGKEIYFNCPVWNASSNSKLSSTIELVDGKQRLHAVLRFLKGEIKAFGLTADQFEDKAFMLRDLNFFVNINDLPTRKEVMQWYVDMNAGGTVHAETEIERVKDLIKAEDK